MNIQIRKKDYHIQNLLTKKKNKKKRLSYPKSANKKRKIRKKDYHIQNLLTKKEK